MSGFALDMISPCVSYLDMLPAANALARRPGTLEGKVLGLVPNWRPAAIHLLTAAGDLLRQRYRLEDVVVEPPVRVSAMARGGKLLDGMRDQLEAFARRVNVAIAATGD
jgi:hypothetical protein